MTFFGMVTLATALLHHKKRISYPALRQEFSLSDIGLEALVTELIQIEQVAVDDDGQFLVWSGADDVQQYRSSSPARGYFAAGRDDLPLKIKSANLPNNRTPTALAAPNDEAERRQLTVMFCDLVESTMLSTELDPEDLRHVIQLYHQTCTDVLELYDGYVAKYMGDGILAYFGYPRAWEGDATRSVHAGLAIVQAISELNARSMGIARPLAVRIGIATGLVVVGDLIGEGDSQERNVVGKTPNLAARLQGLAMPNQVIIAADTYDMTGSAFDCEDLGLQDLKGIAEPAQAWRVIAERIMDQREELIGDAETLVGRQEELAHLLSAWEQATAGEGRVMALSSEAGLGKSRLTEALSRHVILQGGARAIFRCSPYHANNALYPVVYHLQSVFGWQRNDDEPTRLAKLEQALRRYQFPDVETIQLLANLLSLPLPEERFKPLIGDPEKQRQRTLDTIVMLLLQDLERCATLQIWEDLEWADPSTLELLELLIDRCGAHAAMILMTFRPEFGPMWAQRSVVAPLTLSRLNHHDIEAVVLQETSGKPLPDILISQIVDRADGVPLYARELTKMVVSSNLIREVEGRYELAQLATDVTIPATLQESLMARLDGLGSAKNLAQLGAAIGDQFSPQLLGAIATEDASTIKQALDSLVDADLLARRGQGSHLTYRFRQGLIRDVAYESLLRQRREALHGTIAEAIESLEDAETEERTVILAYHYGRSCNLDKAVAYTLRAGDHAARLHARAEAANYYNQALITAQKLGDSPQLQMTQIDAILKLATVSSTQAELERDEHNLNEAKLFAETLGDQSRLAQVFYRLGRLHYARGDGEAAAKFSEDSLAIADHLGDEILAAPAINLLGRYYALQGKVIRGSEMLARNVEQMKKVGDTAEEATAAGFAGMAFGWRGDFSKGFTYADRGLDLATRIGDPFALAAAHNYRGAVHLQNGSWTQAIADLESGRHIAEDSGDDFRAYILKTYEGEAQIESNRPEKARELLDEAIAFAKEIGTTFQLGVAMRSFASCMLLFGKIDSAIVACNEAIQIADEANELLVKSRACRLLVEIWCQLGKVDYQEAQMKIDEAIQLQSEFGAKPEHARSKVVHARLLLEQGDEPGSRQDLEQAIDMFGSLDMQCDLDRAQQLLRQFEGDGEILPGPSACAPGIAEHNN